MPRRTRLSALALGFAALAALPALSSAGERLGWLDPSRFAVGVKYTGLSYHPGGGENEEHYKRSLDDKDTWVVQLGAQVDGDYLAFASMPEGFTWMRFIYLRFSTSLYRDCADVWAGYFHFDPRLNLPLGRFSLRVGIGPTFLWRENWLGVVKGYEKDSFFGPAREETFQSRYISYGGDVEAEWRAWEKVSLVYSVIPGWPEVVQSAVGLRFTF